MADEQVFTIKNIEGHPPTPFKNGFLRLLVVSDNLVFIYRFVLNCREWDIFVGNIISETDFYYEFNTIHVAHLKKYLTFLQSGVKVTIQIQNKDLHILNSLDDKVDKTFFDLSPLKEHNIKLGSVFLQLESLDKYQDILCISLYSKDTVCNQPVMSLSFYVEIQDSEWQKLRESFHTNISFINKTFTYIQRNFIINHCNKKFIVNLTDEDIRKI